MTRIRGRLLDARSSSHLHQSLIGRGITYFHPTTRLLERVSSAPASTNPRPRTMSDSAPADYIMDGEINEQPRPPTPITGGELVVLSKRSDLTISVYSPKDSQGQRALTKFAVQKDALTAFSEYFTASLRFNSALHAGDSHHVELKDDDIGAMRVWFVYMHAAYKSEAAADSETDERPAKRIKMAADENAVEEAIFHRDGVFDTDIERIWHIINAADKYLLDATILQGFFDQWYRKNVDMAQMEADFARQLALPCYMFDHAQGFAEVTKWLAYNFAGHITEKRPKSFRWQHMRFSPPDFVRKSPLTPLSSEELTLAPKDQ